MIETKVVSPEFDSFQNWQSNKIENAAFIPDNSRLYIYFVVFTIGSGVFTEVVGNVESRRAWTSILQVNKNNLYSKISKVHGFQKLHV